jgi:hypothetical protein
MREKPAVVTNLPPSPDEERHGRMLKYAIAMGIRVVCIGLCLVTPGWWLLIPATGAIVLPYFAVIIASTANSGRRDAVARPGAIELRRDQRP